MIWYWRGGKSRRLCSYSSISESKHHVCVCVLLLYTEYNTVLQKPFQSLLITVVRSNVCITTGSSHSHIGKNGYYPRHQKVPESGYTWWGLGLSYLLLRYLVVQLRAGLYAHRSHRPHTTPKPHRLPYVIRRENVIQIQPKNLRWAETKVCGPRCGCVS